MAEEFIETRTKILGSTSNDVRDKIRSLANLGYWPLKIKSIPEGTIVPTKNALMTMESTHPDFYWTVGFVESLLLKVWYPTTVATNVLQYRRVVDKQWDKTDNSDIKFLRDFAVHDFGYRSDSSEESAAISGAAHLILFKGSDTVPALGFINKYYENTNNDPIMLSVPATEHSVMCSFGKDNEYDAFERILELYPEGIVSIVSDTYDIWHVCTEYLPKLKDRILSRKGKVVIRPDSGNPPDIICGLPGTEHFTDIKHHTPEAKGVLRLLDEQFGHTINNRGFRVLNEKIGLIYGDGQYLERYKTTLDRMEKMGYAASNLVVGIGGILRQGTRDTLGFALKATHVEVKGEPIDIIKTPVTDMGKASHTGLFKVYRDFDGKIFTHDQATRYEEGESILETVFLNGKLHNQLTFDQVKKNYKDSVCLI